MTKGSGDLKKRKDFETIYHRFFNFYYQVAVHFLHHEDEAKEVVQESFIRLWEKEVYLKTDPEIRNYLFILVRNRCLNLLRDRRKLLQENGGEEYLSVLLRHRMLSETGEDILLYRELAERIHEAVARLSPQCREVFSLSRFEDLSNSQIAAKLQISVKAVEANMTRALRKLRQELAPYLSKGAGTENRPGIRVFLIFSLCL
ncbi:MAG: RNA polymerase sigma-70 factor [Mangrovibacterium sp.]